MTRAEFGKLAAGLRESYPDQNILNTPDAVEWWYSLLKDLDYTMTATAITRWISTERFAPKIADIRNAVAEIALGEIPDWGQGWNEVKNAISVHGYYRPKEALDSMSEITREVVKRMGWQTLCLSNIENEPTDRANFRMIYEELVKRKAKDAQTPGYLRDMIAGIQGKMPKPINEKKLDELIDKERRESE